MAMSPSIDGQDGRLTQDHKGFDRERKKLAMLPLEVISHVLHHLLVHEDYLHTSFLYPRYPCVQPGYRVAVRTFNDLKPVFLSSKIIKQEAETIFWSKNIFSFNGHSIACRIQGYLGGLHMSLLEPHFYERNRTRMERVRIEISVANRLMAYYQMLQYPLQKIGGWSLQAILAQFPNAKEATLYFHDVHWFRWGPPEIPCAKAVELLHGLPCDDFRKIPQVYVEGMRQDIASEIESLLS